MLVILLVVVEETLMSEQIFALSTSPLSILLQLEAYGGNHIPGHLIWCLMDPGYCPNYTISECHCSQVLCLAA